LKEIGHELLDGDIEYAHTHFCKHTHCVSDEEENHKIPTKKIPDILKQLELKTNEERIVSNLFKVLAEKPPNYRTRSTISLRDNTPIVKRMSAHAPKFISTKHIRKLSLPDLPLKKSISQVKRPEVKDVPKLTMSGYYKSDNRSNSRLKTYYKKCEIFS
jgi:hypothetical protein